MASCNEPACSGGRGRSKSGGRDDCGSGYGYLRARQTKRDEPGCNIKRNKFGCDIDY